MELAVKVEKVGANGRNLEITVSVEDLNQALNKAAREIGKKVTVPGFRPGKAPRMVLEGHVGEQALLDEAADKIISEAFAQAVTEIDLWPVAQPEIDVVTLAKDEPFVFIAKMEVMPEVVLGQYEGIEVAKEVVAVEETEVTAELDALKERLSKLEVMAEDEVAILNDTLTIDFEGFTDGVAFAGGKSEGYALELGSHSFIIGFEEQLVGTKVGDDVEVNVTFPAEYHAPELAAKDAMFKVHVHEIKRRIKPELNDEFAASVDEECDTLDALKEKITADLTVKHDKFAEETMQRAALDIAFNNAEIEIPEGMIKTRLEQMTNEFAQQLQQQGLSLEMYYQYTGSTQADFEAQSRPRAEMNVRGDLVLEAIVKERELEVSDADFDEYIEKMAESYGQPAEALKEEIGYEQGAREYITNNLKLSKAVELIINSIVVKEA